MGRGWTGINTDFTKGDPTMWFSIRSVDYCGIYCKNPYPVLRYVKLITHVATRYVKVQDCPGRFLS